MNKAKQEVLEILYSKKESNIVLHETIQYELDKLFLNWTIGAYYAIDNYLTKEYSYESKNIRVATLQKKIDEDGLDWLLTVVIAAVIHTTNEQTIQQCVGYIQNYMPHEDPFDKVKTAAEILAICSSDKGLYTIVRRGTGNTTIIRVNAWKVIQKKLLSMFDWINNTSFNLPLVEPPKKVTDNNHCGYHILHEPLLLGAQTQHNEKQNTTAINSLNNIEWVLDPNVLKEPEVPSKPLITKEQKENFAQMAIESQNVYAILGNEKFYFAWQYDSRGRIYSHGYHVNFQSVEYKKACLSFNKLEKLT